MLFTFCSQSKHAKDTLDSIESDSKLVGELKDCFHAFHINRILEEQAELFYLYINREVDGKQSLIEDFISVCDSLKQTHFNDKELKKKVENHLFLTIEMYDMWSVQLERDTNNMADTLLLKPQTKVANYRSRKMKYDEYLQSKFPRDHFVKMSEENMLKKFEKINYIQSKDYGQYEQLKETNLKSAIKLLEDITENTTDFQERSIYQIELADQYEKQGDVLNGRSELANFSSNTAMNLYKSILDSRKYSLYLFEAWLKWRAVTQMEVGGMSNTSNIPNDEYDKVREQAANVILEQIAKHEEDEMAINQFLLLATHDMIKRYGAYPLGNQGVLEYLELFHDIK